jgi:TPR repeat protein
MRSQPRSALQADQQFSSAPAVFKQQPLPQQQQQQVAGFHSQQAAQSQLAVNANELSASDSDSSDSAGPVRVPLKLVVADAVKRWFNETLSEARRGDVKQQALLSQMYAEGYGCKQDMEQSKVWGERARLRGYQMSGVYDAY